jgi:hypothetical protein
MDDGIGDDASIRWNVLEAQIQITLNSRQDSVFDALHERNLCRSACL